MHLLSPDHVRRVAAAGADAGAWAPNAGMGPAEQISQCWQTPKGLVRLQHLPPKVMVQTVQGGSGPSSSTDPQAAHQPQQPQMQPQQSHEQQWQQQQQQPQQQPQQQWQPEPEQPQQQQQEEWQQQQLQQQQQQHGQHAQQQQQQ